LRLLLWALTVEGVTEKVAEEIFLRELTAAERATIRAWILAGAPERSL
jgi:hypothetical protein